MLKWLKNMKLWKKILLGILLVLVIGISVIAVWQWNNIKAVIFTVTKSEQEIVAELNATKEKLHTELQGKYSVTVRDFTAEEERQIMKGEITPEEAIKRLEQEYGIQTNSDGESADANNKNTHSSTESSTGSYAGNAGNSSVDTPSKTTSTGTESRNELDSIVGDKIIKLYSLKAYYLGQLGQLEATVKKEYGALPKEKRNQKGKRDIATKYIGSAYAMLEECDAQVETLVSELQTQLKALNADTSIIKTIRDTYESEKALKKAYYIKLLGK